VDESASGSANFFLATASLFWLRVRRFAALSHPWGVGCHGRLAGRGDEVSAIRCAL